MAGSPVGSFKTSGSGRGGGVNLKKIHKTTDDTTSFCSQTFSLFVIGVSWCVKAVVFREGNLLEDNFVIAKSRQDTFPLAQ